MTGGSAGRRRALRMLGLVIALASGTLLWSGVVALLKANAVNDPDQYFLSVLVGVVAVVFGASAWWTTKP